MALVFKVIAFVSPTFREKAAISASRTRFVSVAGIPSSFPPSTSLPATVALTPSPMLRFSGAFSSSTPSALILAVVTLPAPVTLTGASIFISLTLPEASSICERLPFTLTSVKLPCREILALVEISSEMVTDWKPPVSSSTTDTKMAPLSRVVTVTLVLPVATIRTPSLVTTRRARLEFSILMLLEPPPLTMVAPWTVTPFRVTSPSPIPSSRRRSPVMVIFCRITPAADTATSPSMTSLPSSGP